MKKSKGMKAKTMEPIPKEIKAKSIVSKDEWREYTKTVWHIANVSDPDHPAVFPVEIPHRLIKLFSFYGEVVLDPFAGVGTTARAAIPLGRQVVCVDQNPIHQRDQDPMRSSQQWKASLGASDCGEG